MQRPRIVRTGGERRRTEDLQEGRERSRVIERQIEICLQMATRVEPAGIDDPQVKAVENQAPRCVPPHGHGDGEAPEGIARVAPRRHQQRDRPIARSKGGGDGRFCRFNPLRRLEAERGKQRRGRLQHGARCRGRAEHRAAAAPGNQLAVRMAGSRRLESRRQQLFDERAREEMAFNPRQHG